jgi:alcohol dehydrogenase
MENIAKAQQYLKEFKGSSYIFGNNCIDRLPELCKDYGKKVSVILSGIGQEWARPYNNTIINALKGAGYILAGDIIPGASPNAPREDVFTIRDMINQQQPDFIVTMGGGSSIDATKAAVALAVLGDKYPNIDDYFGVGQVSEKLQETGRELIPLVAVQVAASSAAHLTKYSNITDVASGQKMLIVDDAVTPPKALFDFTFTMSSPASLTLDGAFDGISHCLEVLMGIPEEKYEKAKKACLTGIELVVNNVKRAIDNPGDRAAREAIGLATDLGGYAIMIGGTNGAHLNSFSMTEILSHGRACALMNPYYVTFFSTAISERLLDVAAIYKNAGLLSGDLSSLSDRELGEAVSTSMINLSKSVGFPTRLSEVEGFTDSHIEKCLTAAKNPKLDSKLKNMPVPLTSDLVDQYMGSVLQAAKTGELGKILNYVS